MGLSGGPIWSVIIWLINKIRRQQSRRPIFQSRVWLQTELGNMKSCYQLVITITFLEKKIHLGQTSPVETMSKEKKFPRFFFQDKWLFLWLLWSILWLLLLSDYNCTEFVKNEAANAPITFEEIIMVMIKTSMREYSKVKK